MGGIPIYLFITSGVWLLSISNFRFVRKELVFFYDVASTDLTCSWRAAAWLLPAYGRDN